MTTITNTDRNRIAEILIEACNNLNDIELNSSSSEVSRYARQNLDAVENILREVIPEVYASEDFHPSVR